MGGGGGDEDWVAGRTAGAVVVVVAEAMMDGWMDGFDAWEATRVGFGMA